MRVIVKILAVSFLLVGMSACSCFRSSKGGNIPYAESGGPLQDVHFTYDSFALGTTANAIIESNVAWLKENDDAQVQLEGHCDNRGTNEYNMVLGANRSKAVFDYLRTMGISADRMSTVSYGEELPLDPRNTEDAWAKNRRVHFNVVN